MVNNLKQHCSFPRCVGGELNTMSTDFNSSTNDLLTRIRSQIVDRWLSTDDQALQRDVERTSFYSEIVRTAFANDNRYDPSPTPKSYLGTYEHRQVIGLNSRIHGGVYIGKERLDAVVVDEQYGELNKIYRKLIHSYINRFGGLQPNLFAKNFLLPQAKKLAEECLPTTSERLLSQLRMQEGVGSNQKMALDMYIQFGCGARRHQALLFAYLVEKLSDSKLIDARLYFDPGKANQQNDENVRVDTSRGKPFYFEA